MHRYNLMYRFFGKIFLFTSLVISLVSCIEIVEEVTLQDDGKGKIDFTINLSQGKTKLSSIMLMDSINGYKVPSIEQVNYELDKIKMLAEKTNGIHNVNLNRDFNEFIFDFHCDFDSIESLNHFISQLKIKNTLDASLMPEQNHFQYDVKSKTYYRNTNYLIAKGHGELKNADKAAFVNAKYIAITRFESPIKSVSNQSANISPNKKATMLKVNVQDLIKETENISNKIILTK